MDWIVENWELLLALLPALYAVAAVVVKLTPTPKDDVALNKIHSFVVAIAPFVPTKLKGSTTSTVVATDSESTK